MKHLKKYKIFESTKSIDDICKKYGIKNYTINTDGTVDVNGGVDLSFKELEKIPLKFGEVTGDFSCSHNRLTTLEGCPTEVGGGFWCNNNQLLTLDDCPHTVGGGFSCSYNLLTTLEGCPHTVGGGFSCRYNQLTTLDGGPSTVGGHFLCHYNQLLTLDGLTDVSIGGRFFYKDNPIYRITGDWLINDYYPDMDRIELFNDISVVVGNKLYLPKLEYFHEEIGVPLPKLDEVKKYYKIIE